MSERKKEKEREYIYTVETVENTLEFSLLLFITNIIWQYIAVNSFVSSFFVIRWLINNFLVINLYNFWFVVQNC